MNLLNPGFGYGNHRNRDLGQIFSIVVVRENVFRHFSHSNILGVEDYPRDPARIYSLITLTLTRLVT